MGLNNFNMTLLKSGVTAEDACNTISNFSSYISPFTEEDLQRIRTNPTLSMPAKIRIIKNMKKQMVRK